MIIHCCVAKSQVLNDLVLRCVFAVSLCSLYPFVLMLRDKLAKAFHAFSMLQVTKNRWGARNEANASVVSVKVGFTSSYVEMLMGEVYCSNQYCGTSVKRN